MRIDLSKFGKFAAILGAMVCLTPMVGCMTTPVSSMVKLARITPLEASPAEMKFAIKSPGYLKVRNGDITVSLSFDTGQTETSLLEVYKPIIDENAVPGQGISIGAQDGSRLAIARFSAEDAASMRAAQKRVKTLRANGVEGKGSFSVGATGCVTNKAPDGPIFITTWLKTSQAEDFFIVTKNIDLRKVLAKSTQRASKIQSCG